MAQTNQKEKIISFSMKKFLAEGFYKISMDEIAAELRMSKKTIYKNFPQKLLLVEAIMNRVIDGIRVNIDQIVQNEENAVRKLIALSNLIAEMTMKMSENWLNDIRLHGSELWTLAENFRQDKIYETFSKILTQGKKESLVIDKPNIILITIIYSAIKGILNPDFLINNNYSATVAANLTLDTLFLGILSKQGRKIYKQYKREESDD